MSKMTRFDFVFSYWIFFWYILYELHIVSYNPKFALTIALIENLIMLSLMLYYSNSIQHILSFCFINFFIKIIPLWRLRKSNYNMSGVYSCITLFCIYYIWLKINIGVPYNYINLIKKDKPVGPFTYLMNLNKKDQ